MGAFSERLVVEEAHKQAYEAQIVAEYDAHMRASGWNDCERTTTVKMLQSVSQRMVGARDADTVVGSRAGMLHWKFRIAKERHERMRAALRGEVKDANLSQAEIEALRRL